LTPAAVQLWQFEANPTQSDMRDPTVHTGHKNHDRKRGSLKILGKKDDNMVQAQAEDAPIANTVEKWDIGSKPVMS